MLNSTWSQWDSETESYSKGEIREDIVLSGPQAKEHYERLLQIKDEIESSLKSSGVAEEIHWYNPDDAQLCRIFVRKSAAVGNRDLWREQQEWLLSRAEAFYQVFAPFVKSLW